MIDNIENKIENLRLQECSLKNRSFWELIILLETYMKCRQTVASGLYYIKDFVFIILFDFEILWISTGSSVELFNILSCWRFFFNNFLQQF